MCQFNKYKISLSLGSLLDVEARTRRYHYKYCFLITQVHLTHKTEPVTSRQIHAKIINILDLVCLFFWISLDHSLNTNVLYKIRERILCTC